MSVIYNTQTCSIKNNRVHLGEHTPVLLGEHTPPCNLLIFLDLPGFLSNDLKAPQRGRFHPTAGPAAPGPPGLRPRLWRPAALGGSPALLTCRDRAPPGRAVGAKKSVRGGHGDPTKWGRGHSAGGPRRRGEVVPFGRAAARCRRHPWGQLPFFNLLPGRQRLLCWDRAEARPSTGGRLRHTVGGRSAGLTPQL